MEPTDSHRDIQPNTGIALLLAAIVIRLSLSIMLHRNGYLFYTMDEPTRWNMSVDWSHHPYPFTGWDGIWLTGSFAYYGAWIKLFGHPILGMQAGVLIAVFLTMSASYFLAWTMSERHWIGAAVVWLFTPAYPFLWFGHGPLAESLVAGLFMFSFAFCWKFLMNSRYPLTIWINAATASLLLFATASIHYVAWLAILIGALFFSIAFWRRYGKLSSHHKAAVTLILLGAVLFPILWMIGSNHYLGHPLQFMRNQAAIMENYMTLLGRPDDPLLNFLVYPKTVVRQTGLLLPVVIVLGAIAAWRGSAVLGVRILFGYILSLLLFMCLMAMRNGYGVPERSITIVYSLILILFSLSLSALEPLWNYPKTRVRRLLLGASMGLLTIGWFGFNGLIANRYVAQGGNELEHDNIALAGWLQQEALQSHALAPLSADSRIGIFERGGNPGTIDIIRYLSGMPVRLVYISEQQWSSGQTPAIDYLITNFTDSSSGFIPMKQFGRWCIQKPDDKP